ncbi:hypothetical protein DSECCO2_451110 [anaerobic digester metagenome]
MAQAAEAGHDARLTRLVAAVLGVVIPDGVRVVDLRSAGAAVSGGAAQAVQELLGRGDPHLREDALQLRVVEALQELHQVLVLDGDLGGRLLAPLPALDVLAVDLPQLGGILVLGKGPGRGQGLVLGHAVAAQNLVDLGRALVPAHGLKIVLLLPLVDHVQGLEHCPALAFHHLPGVARDLLPDVAALEGVGQARGVQAGRAGLGIDDAVALQTLGDPVELRRIARTLQVHGPARLLVGHAHAHHLLDHLVVHVVLDAALGPVLNRAQLLAALNGGLCLLHDAPVEGVDVLAGLPRPFLEALLHAVLLLQRPAGVQGPLAVVLDPLFLDAGHVLAKAAPVTAFEPVAGLPGFGLRGAHAAQLGLDLGGHLPVLGLEGLALQLGPLEGVLHPGPLGRVLAQEGRGRLGRVALLDALDDGGRDLDALDDHVGLVRGVHALLHDAVPRRDPGLDRPVHVRADTLAPGRRVGVRGAPGGSVGVGR